MSDALHGYLCILEDTAKSTLWFSLIKYRGKIIQTKYKMFHIKYSFKYQQNKIGSKRAMHNSAVTFQIGSPPIQKSQN